MTCRHPYIACNPVGFPIVYTICLDCGRWWLEVPIDPGLPLGARWDGG